MQTLFSRFLKDEAGATAIEYGLLAGLISMGCVAAVNAVGGQISATFEQIAAVLDGAPAH